jgi:hypothetical protein
MHPSMENQNLTRQLGIFWGEVTSPSDAPRHSGIPDKWLPFHSTIGLHEAVYEKLYQKRRWGWLQITAVVFALVALVGALVPTLNSVAPRANQSMAVSNCQQILFMLNMYASDFGGKYPDMIDPAPTTSNQAFLVLIRDGTARDERLFGCPVSKFVPDGKIGTAPDYSLALEAGENHWAMTKGVMQGSSSHMPLVFENPLVASWPPVWDATNPSKPVKGRVWRGGKVIIGFNDTSVQAVKIEPPTSGESKKDVFTDAAASMEILDIKE